MAPLDLRGLVQSQYWPNAYHPAQTPTYSEWANWGTDSYGGFYVPGYPAWLGIVSGTPYEQGLIQAYWQSLYMNPLYQYLETSIRPNMNEKNYQNVANMYMALGFPPPPNPKGETPHPLWGAYINPLYEYQPPYQPPSGSSSGGSAQTPAQTQGLGTPYLVNIGGGTLGMPAYPGGTPTGGYGMTPIFPPTSNTTPRSGK